MLGEEAPLNANRHTHTRYLDALSLESRLVPCACMCVCVCVCGRSPEVWDP